MGEVRVIRLLVVEDSRAYVYLIQRAFLARQGEIRWELTVAEDGEQALNILFGEEEGRAPFPDLILLDWNLPKVDGNVVLQRIKEHPRLRRIPVLIFSASEGDVDMHAAYDWYANGYIRKPSDPDVLNAIVETIERFWIAVAQIPKVARSGQAVPSKT
jgi:chemotaxis family two-component system response regulator Rcp1